MKNRVLIRVADSVKVSDFAKQLIELGFEVLCSRLNSELLSDNGIEFTPIETAMGFNTKLGIVTEAMQNRIYAGILADRTSPEQIADLKENDIEPIDIVCVNINDYDLKNDISAISLIKAAVSNVNDVTVVVDFRDYDKILDEIRTNGEVSQTTRISLGVKAMEYIVHKEILHTQMLKRRASTELFPKYLNFTYEKVRNLKNGENKNQSAAYYKEINNIEPTIPNLKRLKGVDLEFYDISKINNAIELIKEFEETAVVIMGDVLPHGVGMGESLYEAYINCVRYEFYNASSAVAVLNERVSRKVALEIIKTDLAAVIAPAYDEDALELLMQTENVNIYEILNESKCVTARTLDMKTISGGALIQSVDHKIITRNDISCATEKSAEDRQINDMLLAIRTAKHLKTSCCVATKGNQVLGIGSGENSSLVAQQVALQGAEGKTIGGVLGFDVAITNTKIIDAAIAAGISVIIQSGGSEKDEEIINYCNENSVIMYFTNAIYNKIA